MKPAVQTGFVVVFKGSKIFCLSLGQKILGPVVRRERVGAMGIKTPQKYSLFNLFNGEPRSYLEFPNHQIVGVISIDYRYL